MGFIVALVFVTWLAMMIAALWLAIDVNGWIGWPIAAIVLIGGLGTLIQAKHERDGKGPCVQYETQMHYSAATKTMMPARVCVLRGEWLEEME